MNTFLLLFSLFLNVLAIFAIIILFLRQNRLLQVEKKQEKMISDMEEVIAAYLLQMKEENEAFIERVKNLEIRPTSINAIDRGNVEIQEEDAKELLLQSRIGKASAYKAANAYKQNSKVAVKDTIQKTNEIVENESVNLPSTGMDNDESINAQEDLFLKQVLDLKEQGFTEEKIAQKLNRGRTEIELLLKFKSNH